MLALMHLHHLTSSVQTHSFSRILLMDSLTNTDSFYKRCFLERRLLWAMRVTSFSMRPMGVSVLGGVGMYPVRTADNGELPLDAVKKAVR